MWKFTYCMQCEISYFTWKFTLKSRSFSLFYVNFRVNFIYSAWVNDSLELSYIWHRSNNHEASASMLRSDSVATLDSGHVHFILFLLPDGPAASFSSHKQQHQVMVFIDAIISLTASQASSEKYCLTSSTAARSSHACIAMPSFKSDTGRTSPSRIAQLKAVRFEREFSCKKWKFALRTLREYSCKIVDTLYSK